MLVVIAMLTKNPKAAAAMSHEFCPAAEHQVGLSEGTTFQNENWAASKSLADTAISPGHVRSPKAEIAEGHQHFR